MSSFLPSIHPLVETGIVRLPGCLPAQVHSVQRAPRLHDRAYNDIPFLRQPSLHRCSVARGGAWTLGRSATIGLLCIWLTWLVCQEVQMFFFFAHSWVVESWGERTALKRLAVHQRRTVHWCTARTNVSIRQQLDYNNAVNMSDRSRSYSRHCSNTEGSALYI